MLLPPVKDITNKFVRETLEDAPEEDGTVPVKYLNEDIYGMVTEAEVHEFNEANAEVRWKVPKKKLKERDAAMRVAHELLKTSPIKEIEELTAKRDKTQSGEGKGGKGKKRKDRDGEGRSASPSATIAQGTDDQEDSLEDAAPLRDEETGEYLCPSCHAEQKRTVLVKCSGKETCQEYLCGEHDDDLACLGTKDADGPKIFACEHHIVGF